jgi:arylsulfatase A-like enzyme
MIEHLDDAVGQILATLDRLGLRENTIIVFTSDNGGLLGTRGVPSAAPVVTNNYPLRAGKGTPYEGGVRVPLLVRYPPVVTAGSKSNVAVISPDFFPTLLDLAGLGAKVTVPANLDGISFAPVLRGERTRLSREAMFWHYPHYHGEGATPYSAILKGPWKLVHFFEDDHLELYDVDRDIWEQHDLTQTEPATRDELFGELGVWRTKVGAQLPTKNPKYDPARGRSRGAQSPDKG